MYAACTQFARIGAHITSRKLLGPSNQNVQCASHSVGKEVPAERAFIVRQVVEHRKVTHSPIPEQVLLWIDVKGS